MSAKGLLARGRPATEPKWLFFVRIAILVLSLIILAVAAYAVSVTNGYYGGGGAGGFLIFICIKSFIVYGGTIAVERFAPHMFFRIVALILYGLSIIFWLSAWAWSASLAGFWLSLYSGYDYGYYYGDYAKKEGAALAVCAALGAVTWILTIVNAVFFIKAALADPEGDAPAHNAELGQVKHQEAAAGATQPGYNQPAQQQYGEPAPYQQQHYPEQQHQQPQPYAQQQPYATQ